LAATNPDPEKYEVWVEFLARSGPYVYLEVPPEVYDELEEAEHTRLIVSV